MNRNTNETKMKNFKTNQAFVLPKRLKNNFTFIIASYAIFGSSAGLYLIATAVLSDVELGKFIQYPTSIPFLVAVFVSFFLLYVSIMMRQHVMEDGKMYKEDTYILKGMIVMQVLTFNYLTLIPSVLLYLSLRKHSIFIKEKYPYLDNESKVLPIVTEKGFYRITFTIIVLAIIFAVLVALTLISKL